MTIAAKTANNVAALLIEYSALTDLGKRIAKASRQQFTLSANDTGNDSDFLSVEISSAVARIAIERQLAVVNKRLANLGLTICAA